MLMRSQFILQRDVSDHCPIVVKNKVYGWGSKPFRILNGWFQDRRFFEVVKEAWKKQDVVRWET